MFAEKALELQCCRNGPCVPVLKREESNLMSGLVANADELNYRGVYVQEDSIILLRAGFSSPYIAFTCHVSFTDIIYLRFPEASSVTVRKMA